MTYYTRVENNETEENVMSDADLATKLFCHKTLEERAANFSGKLNLDGEFDWGQPTGREVW